LGVSCICAGGLADSAYDFAFSIGQSHPMAIEHQRGHGTYEHQKDYQYFFHV
jgi:hypothetical protein